MFDRTVHIVSYLWVRAWEKSGYWNNMDKISDYLYLSSLPMRGSEEKLIKDVGAQGDHSMLVVSVVEDYENNETLPFMDPTRKDEWEKKFHVNHDQVKMKDFSPGDKDTVEIAAKVVVKIQRHRLKEQGVLVHCKAGRTRSAMMVALVLALYDFGQQIEHADKTPKQLIDMAIEFIQKKRPQVKVNEDVKDTAVKIFITVREMMAAEIQQLPLAAPVVSEVKREVESEFPDGLSDESLKVKVDSLFANTHLKEEIIKMNAYKNLCLYRDNVLKDAKFKSNRATLINDIIDCINSAKDGEWFASLMRQSGPAIALIKAKPFLNVQDKNLDQAMREALIDKLRYDIQSLICMNLGCSKSEFEKLYSPLIHQPSLQPF